MPFAQLCAEELFWPVAVCAASAFLFIDGAFLSSVYGCITVHVRLDSLVYGAHNIELIPVDRNGSVCSQPPGDKTSSIVFFDIVSCANGPPVPHSRRPTHIVTELAPWAIFSTMQCVGIDGRDFKNVGSEVAVSGTCWMQDVCYEAETETLLFFSESGSEPWQFSEYDDYRLPILSTKPSPMNLGRISFRMVKWVGPLARAGEEVSYLDAESSVLYSPLAPWAWGLFLIETLWAVFMMQHTFGMVSAGAQIISAFDCEGLGLLYSQLGPHWSSPTRLSPRITLRARTRNSARIGRARCG
jgi:hypothetical protein